MITDLLKDILCNYHICNTNLTADLELATDFVPLALMVH